MSSRLVTMTDDNLREIDILREREIEMNTKGQGVAGFG